MRLAIFTTSRADFGILLPLLKAIKKTKRFNLSLFVGGSHVDKNSDTIKEILNSKIYIKKKFEYSIKSDKKFDIVNSLSDATKKVNHIFKTQKFDAALVLGDRYELMSILVNCLIHNKPLIHLSGGEITTGAIDNQVRNMISKVANYHFVNSEIYKKNLIKMNENKKNIFNTGALNVDNMYNIRKDKNVNRRSIFKKFKLNLKKKLALFTLHPETLNFKKNSSNKSFKNILKILKDNNYQTIITGTNLDPGYFKILRKINENKTKKDIYFFNSLGTINYLSILKVADIIIGNSSSGIVESPYFKIPCINVDNRQNGRLRHKNIIDTKSDYKNLKSSLKKINSKKFRKNFKNYRYLFGKKGAAQRIVKIISKLSFDKKITVKI